MKCTLFQLQFLIKAAIIAFIFAFASIGDVEAKPSDKCSAEGQKPCPVFYSGPICDRGLGNLGGKCRPCGGEAQRACPPLEQGKQCRGGRKKIEGRCYSACGGPNQKACPKIYPGYPCKGKYEPDGSGICRPCGGANQKSCRVFKPGERCNAGLDEDGNGVCRPCGGRDEPACSVTKKGSICEAGLGKINGLCRPCGVLDKPACPALEQGRQCEEWTTNRGGMCRPCGTPETGACRVTDRGKACREFYDWAIGGRCAETNASITRQRAKEKLEELGSDFIQDTIAFASGANSDQAFRAAIENETTPASIPDNNACPGSTLSWTFGVAGDAGLVFGVGGEAGAAFRCDDFQPDQQDMKWYSGGSWFGGLAGGASAGAVVGFWQEPYNNIRGKAHGLSIGILDIADLSPKVKIPTGKIKGVPVSPDLSIAVWFAVKDDGGVGEYQGITVSFGAAAGKSWFKYIRSSTLQWCDYDMDCALHTWRQVRESGANEGSIMDGGVEIVVSERDKDGITVDITKDGETREDLYFERDTLLDKRDYELIEDGDTVERICFRHNFRELKYRDEDRNCDKGISLKIASNAESGDQTHAPSSAERSVRTRSPSAASGIDILGLWDFETNGRMLTDEFTEQGESYVILRRMGSAETRRYDRVGENQYRNDSGSTFRFVSATRGVWISPDGKTVYQLKKR